MKRRDHLPDFQKLCPPEQNHTAEALSLSIFFFFLCSIGGLLWEMLIMLWKEESFVKRGFLYGPWLPIYGVGAVLFYLLLAPPPGHKKHPLRIFLCSMLLGTGIELLIGWLLAAVWNLRYWDYSGYPFHFHGYICLWSALGFGIAGVLWICLLSGFFARLWQKLPAKFRRNMNTLLVLLFLIDCVASLILPHVGENITFP